VESSSAVSHSKIVLMSSNLEYRIAGDDDLPLLLQYRRECGWGEEAVKLSWTDPDRIYCILEANIDGDKQDIGMGCWYLHQPDDLELACRDTHVVHIGGCYSVSLEADVQLLCSFRSNSRADDSVQQP
jgi:hypothetical protein